MCIAKLTDVFENIQPFESFYNVNIRILDSFILELVYGKKVGANKNQPFYHLMSQQEMLFGQKSLILSQTMEESEDL